MTPWLLLLLVQATAAPPPTGAAPEGTLTLAEAVALARAHSPLAAAARAQAEGAEKAARAAGRLADPTLDLAMEKYDHVVIDNEAGMEHLSRRTTKCMDAFLVISDDTKTGAETAVRILKLARDIGIEIGRPTLVLNKVSGDVHDSVKDIVQASPFEHVVVLPYDRDVERASIEGRSVLEMAGANPFYVKIKTLAVEL